MDGPNRMVLVTGSSGRILGRMQAGTETASPCPALALSCLADGREWGELGMLLPVISMQPHGFTPAHGDHRSSGGQGRKPMGQHEWTQRGDPACPLLWSIIQEGASILAAPWEQAGPARCPRLASGPFSLCTDPPQSSSRPRTSAHQGGDKRHEAQLGASCTLMLIPASLGMAGCPPEPSLSPWKPLPCHSPSCRTIPSLQHSGSCCPTKATHWRPLAPALPHSTP